jgi:mannose-6-phosphate isomerase
MALYPFVFQPIFKERVWGGRALERLYGKALPPDVPIGESWEVSDRPGDESVVINGSLAGRTLRWLMTEHRRELLGPAAPAVGDRFPILCKLLDARQKLSLQVHPPARTAHLGDPKTEMWYIAAAEPGAELYVGLRSGVTREVFEQAIADGLVADCFHRLPVQTGDTMFLPSGRVHAIGAGLVIFEIQQNSDTTFRVYDWDRLGLDGRPRDLHVKESLASIDFDDVEPTLVACPRSAETGLASTSLVRDELFNVDLWTCGAGDDIALPPGLLHLVAVIDRNVRLEGNGQTVELSAGQFGVMPAGLGDGRVAAEADARFLLIAAR